MLDGTRPENGYNRESEKDGKKSGPTLRWELVKARLKLWWPNIFELPTGADMLVYSLYVALAAVVGIGIYGIWDGNTKLDTGNADRSCIETCEGLDGFMIQRTKYGCICHTKKGREIF